MSFFQVRRWMSHSIAPPKDTTAQVYFYGVVEFALQRLTEATRFHISRACKEAHIDMEALLLTMGKPRSSLKNIQYSDLHQQVVSILGPCAIEQQLQTPSLQPPQLDGYLRMFLQPKVGTELIRKAKVMLLESMEFAFRITCFVESSFFSKEANSEELIRDARNAGVASVSQEYSGCEHFMRLLKRIPPYDDVPDVTYNPYDCGRRLCKEILEEVIPAADEVADAGGLDNIGLVSLYKFQVEDLRRIVSQKLHEAKTDNIFNPFSEG